MVNSSLDGLFGSLSDTTRRDMLKRLLDGELTISQLAERYDMSLPAVSKHVRALVSSGLIIKEKHGRQYFVRLTPAALKQAADHLHYYETVLSNRLDAFSSYIQQRAVPAQQSPTSNMSIAEQQILTVTNILDTDPKTAWHAYTDPTSIMQWWNIPGAQLQAVENDIRNGGSWRFTVRGADNREYVFGGVYSTVDYPHRLSYTDGVGEPQSVRPEAHVTITFEQLPDSKTLLTKKSTATPAVHQCNAAWLHAIGGG